jgi:adenylate cyclase
MNVQLINTETGAHIWADRFDTNRANLADAQKEIIGRLMRTHNLQLVAAEASRSEQPNAVDPDARDLVMRGWARYYRPFSATTIKEAGQAFERALELDPRSIDADRPRKGVVRRRK